MSEDKKETPTELDVLENMIDEQIRQINYEIMRQQARKTGLESVKNDIESVRQRFSPSYQSIFTGGATPK